MDEASRGPTSVGRYCEEFPSIHTKFIITKKWRNKTKQVKDVRYKTWIREENHHSKRYPRLFYTFSKFIDTFLKSFFIPLVGQLW